MTDLINTLFNPLPNGIMSILMGFSLIYWLFQMFLGDGFDLGTDADIHFGDITDVDLDSNMDASSANTSDLHAEPSFFGKALEFINVGKVPLMIIITLFKFISWIITLISTSVFELAKFGIWSVLILIPVFIVVFFLMHWLTKPLVKVFKELGYHGEEEIDFIGRVGKMKSTIENDKIGSAEFSINKDIITLNVKSLTGEKINFGDSIIVTDDEITNKYFLVTKHITLNSF